MKKTSIYETVKHSLVWAFTFGFIAAFSQYNVDWIIIMAIYSWLTQFFITFLNAVFNLRLFDFFKSYLYNIFRLKLLSIHLAAIICWIETFITTYIIQSLIWADVWFMLWILFWIITYITFPMYQKILDNNLINRTNNHCINIIKYIFKK
jgi:hypothetical protein